jgi:hypothetical protein
LHSREQGRRIGRLSLARARGLECEPEKNHKDEGDRLKMSQDTNTLFTNALNTVNLALDRHSNEMPFEQILAVADKMLDDEKLGVAVYKDDPDEPHDYFTIRFREGAFEVVSHGKESPSVDGKVSVDYLQRLADDPNEYIENPIKLDLDFLKSRMGLS